MAPAPAVRRARGREEKTTPMSHDELDELDDLEELDELEELPDPEPAARPPIEELDELEEVSEAELEQLPPESAGPSAAAADRTGPRELERAPMMLQKAAALLTVSALLPWLVPSEDGAFPLERTLAKLVVLLGGWVFYQGIKQRHGEATPLAALGKNPKTLATLGLLIMAVGIAPFIDGGGMKEMVEKAAVLVGIVTWCQVQDYAKGGKFNPVLGMVIPLLGMGGLFRLITVFAAFDPFALVGSLGVTIAGVWAGYTMGVAMKEAKEHGKRKKQAALEARKRQRQAKRNR